MAFMMINNIPFTISNDNVVSESKRITSITVEGDKAYATKESETLDITLNFADTDTFFIHKIALFKASLELALRTTWVKMASGFSPSATLYIGRDEFMEWGYCSALSFSGQADDNKKTITISLTRDEVPGIAIDAGNKVSIKNGFPTKT